jgi:2-polyprenyl-3-methyl-5-hydroxy-6-metoxy-1,4-benzoquinol methylase
MPTLEWPVRLFNRSVLKQRKFREITAYLGQTQGLSCLDIGADNGVVSYLLRQRGGEWQSADLDEQAVAAIRALVVHNVFQIDGCHTPFRDDTFDRVVIVDFLEHIDTDRDFINDMYRIIKPAGELIINVPHSKQSLLRRFRLAIGQTDEKHGHVRPGYTAAEIGALLGQRFTIIAVHTYSKFFSECVDTLITAAVDWMKRGHAASAKGRVVTGKDMGQYHKMFKIYSLIYPIVWMVAQFDKALLWCSGYMMIVKARTCKESDREMTGALIERESRQV